MTLSTYAGRFEHIQVEGRSPLEGGRLDLFTRWFDVTVNHPAVPGDSRWAELGVAIVSGRPLIRWVSDDEYSSGLLPAETPTAFLDALDDLVEQEEGVSIQHLSSEGEEVPR